MQFVTSFIQPFLGLNGECFVIFTFKKNHDIFGSECFLPYGAFMEVRRDRQQQIADQVKGEPDDQTAKTKLQKME